jgi:rare lipoprotein A
MQAIGRAVRGALRHRLSLPSSKVAGAGAGVALVAIVAGCSNSTRPQAPLHSSQANQSWYAPVDRYSAKTGSSSSVRVYADGDAIPKGGGHYKLGAPYKIANRWYVPADDPNYDRTGIASWYGADFHGRKTANGEVFDMNALTAAHPTLPLPSYAYVTSLRTGRTVLVRINDRGPYAQNRVMDLSRRTAEVLGVAGAGISEVRVKYAGRAPLSGDDSHERRFLASQPWARHAPALAQTPGAPFAGRMGLFESR